MSTEPEIRRLSKALFAMAKGASMLAFAGEAAALMLGAWFAIVHTPEWTSITALAGVALVTFVLRGCADAWKEKADEQLRKLDLADGLGQAIAQRDRADILADAPVFASWLARRRSEDESYFASARPGSPVRLVENLRESAWWTSHLGRTAEALQRIWLFLFGTLAVGTLILNVARAGITPTFFTAPTFAVAVLLFLFTNGPYRRLGEFRALHEAAARVESDAGHLLDMAERIDEPRALLLAAQYHLARKGAPLLPAFVWRLRKGTLNRLWEAVAREQIGPAGA